MQSFATFLLHEDAESDYRIQHTAPMHDSGSPAWKLTDTYPDDVYGPQAVQYYGTGYRAQDVESFRLVQALRARPNAPVTIYRAVPRTDDIREINVGDWVTINRAYAKGHGESALDGQYKILAKSVKARDIFTNGDSIHEWGYDPQPPQSGLTEAHTPVAWHWLPKPKSVLWSRTARFMIDGAPYEFEVYLQPYPDDAPDEHAPIPKKPTPLGERWGLSFGRMKESNLWPGDTYADIRITNTGNAHAVFATVMDILKNFIENASPNEMIFSAGEDSRIKLYKRLGRMTPQINPAYQYDGAHEDRGHFRIRRTDPVPEVGLSRIARGQTV